MMSAYSTRASFPGSPITSHSVATIFGTTFGTALKLARTRTGAPLENLALNTGT